MVKFVSDVLILFHGCFLFKNLNRKKGLFSSRSCLGKINTKCVFSWKQKFCGL